MSQYIPNDLFEDEDFELEVPSVDELPMDLIIDGWFDD